MYIEDMTDASKLAGEPILRAKSRPARLKVTDDPNHRACNDAAESLLSGISRGFTLIEVLVVIVIIGIITATTLFSIGDGGQKRRIQATVSTLQSALQLAQTQAILTSSVVGFQVNNTGYAFYLFTTAPDKETQRLNAAWVLIKGSTTLSRHKMPSGVLLTLSVSDNLFKKIQDYKGGDTDEQPQVVILPSGGFTPFSLIISDKHKKNAYVLKGNMAGDLSMQPVKSTNE